MSSDSWHQHLPRFSRAFLREIEPVRPLTGDPRAGLYEARYLAEDRAVALHVLRDLRPADMARFVRRSDLLRALQHPHLLGVLHAGTDGPIAFLVSELPRGRSLADRMPRRACSLREALEIGARVADALAYLHAANLVHGRVRPDCIFTTEDLEDVQLGEVGAHRPHDPLAPLRTRMPAPPEFLAPELHEGDEADHLTDQYALAVVVYYLVCHALPTGKDSGPEAISLRRVVPTLPLGAEDAIMRGMARHPAARFPDCAQFAAALRQTVEELGARANQVFAPRSRRAGAGELPDERAEPGVRDLDLLLNEEEVEAPPPRERPGVASRLAFALGGIALVVAVAYRPRQARPPPPPPPPASRSAAAAQRVAQIDWPAHRRLAITLQAPLHAQARLEARDGSAVTTAALDAARVHATFDQLLPDRALALVAVRGAKADELAKLRTPPVVPLSDLVVHAADQTVLVGFTPPAGAELTVELGRTGDTKPLVTQKHLRGARAFRHLFTGLTPAARYWLRVRSTHGWGGLADYPLITRGPDHAALVVEWARAAAGDGDLTGVVARCRAHPDVRMIPPAVALCTQRRDAAIEQFRPLTALAAELRAPELVRALRSVAGDDPERAAVLAYAAALADQPEAAELARVALDGTKDPVLLAYAVRGLATEGASGCDRIAKAKEAVPELGGRATAAAMIRCDRARARHHFLRWIQPGVEDPARVTCGVKGLELLGEGADIDRLTALLSRAEQPAVRVQAAEALAHSDARAAHEALRQAFQWDPERSELLWAAVHLAIRVPSSAAAVAATLEKALRNSPEAFTRRDAALALGLLRSGTGALRDALGDPMPEVVDGAVWALGRAGDAGATARLTELAGGEDPRGMAAWALGALGATSAEQVLLEALRRRAGKKAAAQTALALNAWALGKLRARSAIKDLGAIADDAKQGDLARASARQALLHCWGGGAAGTTLSLLPLSPLERTGIHLAPGDCVDLVASGWWAPPDSTQMWTSGDRFRVDDGVSRCLVAQVGTQLVALDKMGEPRRLVAETEGELLLTAYGVPEDSERDPARLVPRGRLVGMAVIRIDRP